jgi:hypothetical protein
MRTTHTINAIIIRPERAPHDYGLGRTCEHCGGPVNRYQKPAGDLAVYCNLHSSMQPDKSRLYCGHSNQKITDAEADAIRERYAAGDISHADLAKAYGLSRSTVTGILNQLSHCGRR